MVARWIFVSAALAVLAGSGCCCYGPQGGCNSAGCNSAGCNSCGGYAGGCCICWPKPIVWCGNCNECGPHPGEGCGCPSDCGILPALRQGLTCGKGCGEIYWSEWVCDPPDCCDPCDQCHGQWTGPHGYCNLGPCQRLLAALHGYRYCPKPCCDPGCGLCNKPDCTTCGHCGGGQHVSHLPGFEPASGDVYYEGQPGGESILNENWDRAPGPKPTPGKPIHKAEEPSQLKVGQARPAPQPAMQPTYGRMVRTAGYWGR